MNFPNKRKAGAIAAAVATLGLLGTAIIVIVVPASPGRNFSVPTTTTTVPPSTSLTPAASYFTASLLDTTSGAWSVSASSASLIANFVSGIQTNYNTVNFATQPLYYVPPGQANIGMTLKAGCNNFIGSTTGESPASVPIPYSEVTLNGAGDNPLSLYQPSSNTEYEYWQAVNNGASPWAACFGGSMAMSTSTGTFPNGYGRSATGISEVNGMVTENDVYNDSTGSPVSFDHALLVDLPRCNGYKWPAGRGDCGSDPGYPSEGQYFKFPAGLTCSGHASIYSGQNSSCPTPLSQMVFDTIQTYGMVVSDFAGATQIEAEQSSDWAAQGHAGTDPLSAASNGEAYYAQMSTLPWPSLEVVIPPGCPSNCPT